MVAAEPIMLPFFSVGRVNFFRRLAREASMTALFRQDERPWPRQLAAWRALLETNLGKIPVKIAGGRRFLTKKGHA